VQENKQENPAAAELEETAMPNAIPVDGAGATSAETTSEAVPMADAIPSLEELLKAAELKAAEHHDAWLRAKAEGENIRRRAQEDIAKAGKFAIEKFAGELLAVKDSLEAALANEQQDAAALRAGVELTLKQLVSAFEKSNLAEIHPLEEKFDPHRHQAISQIEADGEPNRVINVLQKGYVLNERVIRPALVVVSKARAAPAA
jgi:molecular chaperone GrpE